MWVRVVIEKTPVQHTYVPDGIRRVSTDVKPGTSAVWGPQMTADG